jgi:biofilm PGA synthesis N-glycosyltransferase PgaC
MNTKAVAGSILVRNSRENWITRAQEWDYFLGIASIKRIQSLFQGTLVAQGAFSLYERAALMKVGGWPNTVGEDIVLTWKFLSAGYRIGHAENACVFTNAPNTLRQFIKQRQRWSRGLIEAFKDEPHLLYKPRLTLLFIWWNFLFPFIDIAYTFGFIPGLILALFGKFWLVGPMTLALIPPGLLLNQVMFSRERDIFDQSNLHIRKNVFGFLFYMVAYGIVLQPACVWGYFSEVFRFKKQWGTK